MRNGINRLIISSLFGATAAPGSPDPMTAPIAAVDDPIRDRWIARTTPTRPTVMDRMKPAA
jgi:hypothetical protein